MFQGQCGFCQKNGHNIRACTHPEKREIIHLIENVIDTFNTPDEIKAFIRVLSPVRLELLACQINTAVGLPTPLLRKSLIDYYTQRLRVRIRRHARIEYDWEDTLEQTSSIAFSPHRLFRACMDATTSAFRYLFRGRDRQYQYSYMANTEGNTFRRTWAILPDLSKDEFIEPIDCPICFKNTDKKITLQCCHELCETCFNFYIQEGSILRAPLCPICRKCIQNVTVYNLEAHKRVCKIGNL